MQNYISDTIINEKEYMKISDADKNHIAKQWWLAWRPDTDSHTVKLMRLTYIQQVIFFEELLKEAGYKLVPGDPMKAHMG